MSTPQLVECDADVEVTVTGDLTHQCPYRDEVDHGEVTIAYRPYTHTLELHSLRGWLDGFATAETSHEAITDRIRHDLSLLEGIELLSVSTAWHTASMEVRCVTSQIPATPGYVTP